MRFASRQRAIRASVHRAHFLLLVSERAFVRAHLRAREAMQLKLRFRQLNDSAFKSRTSLERVVLNVNSCMYISGYRGILCAIK